MVERLVRHWLGCKDYRDGKKGSSMQGYIRRLACMCGVCDGVEYKRV